MCLKQVCEVDPAVATSQNLPSSSADVTEQSTSWLPESCSNETECEPVPKTTPMPKVEAVTLMLTAQPGTAMFP